MGDDDRLSSLERPQPGSRSAWLIGLAAFAGIFGVGMAVTIGAATANKEIAAPTAAEPPSGPRPAAQASTVNIPSLGLSVAQPAGWHIVSAEQNADNLRRVDMDDRQLQDLAARYANAPLVAFSKYKEPYADLNPSFKVNVRAAGSFEGRPATEILAAAIPTMSRAFSDLRIEEGPVSTRVSGHPAAYARLAYTLRAGGAAFPTISEVWIVPRGSIFFMIGVGSRADERNGSRAELRSIVESLRID